jgi:hypothetical protein
MIVGAAFTIHTWLLSEFDFDWIRILSPGCMSARNASISTALSVRWLR